MGKKEIKIATIYISRKIDKFQAVTMDTVRWLRISEALARLGYSVDMITNESSQKIIPMAPNLRRVPFKQFDWHDYHVIKTLFQEGFRSLERVGGSRHPFIISKTTVVGSHNMDAIYFYGWHRWRLFQIQKRINKNARYITLANPLGKKLWQQEFGKKDNILIVPSGVDNNIPARRKNPYEHFEGKIVVYIGNIYGPMQRKVNLQWQHRLNEIGSAIQARGIDLCFIGEGKLDKLDPHAVRYLGPVENEKLWDYQYFANCGLVLALGEKQNFESSKIYYYLRSGLPVVSESPVPNNNLIKEAKLGFIAPYNDTVKMIELIELAVKKKWQKKLAVDYMLKNHTWDQRVQIYDKIIEKEFS